MSARLSVAICTWNRCDLLRQTLERMTELSAPPELSWELVVVNNRCTDATDEVLSAFGDRLPLRRVFEAVPGLSNARNAAIREARGEYIVWTDDDVLVDRAWLVEYAAAFARWPQASFFGGPIEPWFEGEPPVWLKTGLGRVRAAYALLDLGPEAICLSTRASPYGANMAFRTADQARFPYQPALGRRPGNLLGGEEADVMRRMLGAGLEGRWVPTARVRHFIPKARQTVSYLRRYYFGWGEYLGRGAELKEASLLGRPLWLWRELVEGELRYLWSSALGEPDRWLVDLQTACTARGRFRWYAAGFPASDAVRPP